MGGAGQGRAEASTAPGAPPTGALTTPTAAAATTGTTPRSGTTGAEGTAADTALTVLYAERYEAMVRLAHLVTGSSAVAPDLVQDAFLKVASRLDALDSAPAYLRVVVVNECRSWLRRQVLERRHERPVGPALDLPPDVDEVWSALRGLSERQRAALVLRFYEDLTYEQIASVLGCRLGTAKSLVHRGLAELKEVIDR